MAISSNLISDIKSAEGLRLQAYKDSVGLWTIGYGHLLPFQNKDWSTYLIDLEEAELWLEQDIEFAQTRACELYEWSSLDTPCRQNALTELVFNMGSKWDNFVKARQAIYNKIWKVAHDELLNSLWATQVGIARSSRIANYLLTGAYALT